MDTNPAIFFHHFFTKRGKEQNLDRMFREKKAAHLWVGGWVYIHVYACKRVEEVVLFLWLFGAPFSLGFTGF
jgi:hypothetical protein